jgi:hypothetical protein
MITELTPEQEAQLAVYAEKWRKISLSTEPANRPEAEKGVKLAYELAGLNPPKEIVWFDSPLELCSRDMNIEEVYPNYSYHYFRSIMDVVDKSVHYNVTESAKIIWWENVSSQIYGCIWSNMTTISRSLLGMVQNPRKLE